MLSKVYPVSYTHLRAHETGRNLVCRLLLEKKKKKTQTETSCGKKIKKIKREKSRYNERTYERMTDSIYIK